VTSDDSAHFSDLSKPMATYCDRSGIQAKVKQDLTQGYDDKQCCTQELADVLEAVGR